MITLEQAHLIGQGHSRSCYLHPHDPTKVLKIPRDVGTGTRQNKIDQYYLASLERRGVPARHVPRQYGMVATSLGSGLAMDLVADADGQPARTLPKLVREREITRDEARSVLDEVLEHFIEHGIVMVDIGLVNFVCKREGERWTAVVIDGLGGRHFDLKLLMRARFLALARIKLRAQWQRLMPKLDACLEGR